MKQAREADWLDRQSITSFGPLRPFPDDFFIWRIALTARIDGVEMCTAERGDGSCTFCKYRQRHYGGAAGTVTALNALGVKRNSRE